MFDPTSSSPRHHVFEEDTHLRVVIYPCSHENAASEIDRNVAMISQIMGCFRPTCFAWEKKNNLQLYNGTDISHRIIALSHSCLAFLFGIMPLASKPPLTTEPDTCRPNRTRAGPVSDPTKSKCTKLDSTPDLSGINTARKGQAYHRLLTHSPLSRHINSTPFHSAPFI